MHRSSRYFRFFVDGLDLLCMLRHTSSRLDIFHTLSVSPSYSGPGVYLRSHPDLTVLYGHRVLLRGGVSTGQSRYCNSVL